MNHTLSGNSQAAEEHSPLGCALDKPSQHVVSSSIGDRAQAHHAQAHRVHFAAAMTIGCCVLQAAVPKDARMIYCMWALYSGAMLAGCEEYLLHQPDVLANGAKGCWSRLLVVPAATALPHMV